MQIKGNWMNRQEEIIIIKKERKQNKTNKIENVQDVIIEDKFKTNPYTFTLCLHGLYFVVFSNMQIQYTRNSTHDHGSIMKHY